MDAPGPRAVAPSAAGANATPIVGSAVAIFNPFPRKSARRPSSLEGRGQGLRFVAATCFSAEMEQPTAALDAGAAGEFGDAAAAPAFEQALDAEQVRA